MVRWRAPWLTICSCFGRQIGAGRAGRWAGGVLDLRPTPMLLKNRHGVIAPARVSLLMVCLLMR